MERSRSPHGHGGAQAPPQVSPADVTATLQQGNALLAQFEQHQQQAQQQPAMPKPFQMRLPAAGAAVHTPRIMVAPMVAAARKAAAERAERAFAEQQARDQAAFEEQERVRKLQEKLELQHAIDHEVGYFRPSLGHAVTGGEFPYYICTPKPLGTGVFSVVWGVADKDNKLVALKVARKQEHFRKHTEREAEILKRVNELRDLDPGGAANIVVLREAFMHEEYFCMAFEKLQDDLRTVGRLSGLEKVLSFSKQLLLALRYLHDKVGLAHCDVKPDNLLMRHDGLAVKLTDFGAARPSGDIQEVDELQPLFYRAPEIFVGAPRGRKIDLWSTGCTIYELTVGRVLFRSCHTAREVVEKIMDLRGPLPSILLRQGRLANVYFSQRGFHPERGSPSFQVHVELSNFVAQPMLPELSAHADLGKKKGLSGQDAAKAQLAQLMGRATTVNSHVGLEPSGEKTETEQKLALLADLVEQLMCTDPAARLTAAAACEHEVFNGVLPPPEAALLEAPPLPKEAPPPLPPEPPPSA